MKLDGRKLSNKALEDIRRSVIARLQAGHKPSQVAKDFGLHPCRVFEYRKLYRVGGLEALRVRKGQTRKKKIFVRSEGKHPFVIV